MIYLELAFLALSLLLGAHLLRLWYLGAIEQREASQAQQWNQEQKSRDKARIAAIEAGLMDWLQGLELPQFAEQTKLQASARQLRIVLVEKLMRGPHVD